MKSHRGFVVIVAVAMLAGSCSDAQTDRVLESPATTVSPVDVSGAPSSTEKPAKVEPEVAAPDLTGGFMLSELGENLALWAVPDDQTLGCEGESGWRVWSVPAGVDPFLATENLFATAPRVDYPSGAIVFTAGCEEQSWQVLYAEVETDGTFVNEAVVGAKGYENLTVQDLLFDTGRGNVVFLLDDERGTRLVSVEPSSGDIDDDFILGSAEQGCSAKGMTVTLPYEAEMSEAAVRTRDRIATAASQCQYDVLALIGGDTLNYSFDADERGAARYWALGEYFGVNHIQMLLHLVSYDSAASVAGDATEVYGWPKASVLPVTAFDESVRQQLVDLGLTPEQVEETMTTGSYYGYRIAIDLEGNWLWFVAGD